MNGLVRKLRERGGFSFTELLAATVILLLATSLVAGAMQLATRQYGERVSRNEAEILCSALSEAIQDELSYAYEPTPAPTDAAQSVVSFHSDTLGGGTAFYIDNADEDSIVTAGEDSLQNRGHIVMASNMTSLHSLVLDSAYDTEAANGALEAAMRLYIDNEGYHVTVQIFPEGSAAGDTPLASRSFIVGLPASVEAGSIATGTYYTVSFETNGGSSIGSQTVSEGAAVVRPSDPAKSDHTFAGWYADSAFETSYDFTLPVTGDMTLYAKWTEVIPTYTVTFNANGGEFTTIENSPIVYVDYVLSHLSASKPDDPTWVGKVFLGWFTEDALINEFDFSAPITDDITLWAKWQPVSYTTIRIEYMKMRADAAVVDSANGTDYDAADVGYDCVDVKELKDSALSSFTYPDDGAVILKDDWATSVSNAYKGSFNEDYFSYKRYSAETDDINGVATVRLYYRRDKITVRFWKEAQAYAHKDSGSYIYIGSPSTNDDYCLGKKSVGNSNHYRYAWKVNDLNWTEVSYSSLNPRLEKSGNRYFIHITLDGKTLKTLFYYSKGYKRDEKEYILSSNDNSTYELYFLMGNTSEWTKAIGAGLGKYSDNTYIFYPIRSDFSTGTGAVNRIGDDYIGLYEAKIDSSAPVYQWVNKSGGYVPFVHYYDNSYLDKTTLTKDFIYYAATGNNTSNIITITVAGTSYSVDLQSKSAFYIPDYIPGYEPYSVSYKTNAGKEVSISRDSGDKVDFTVEIPANATNIKINYTGINHTITVHNIDDTTTVINCKTGDKILESGLPSLAIGWSWHSDSSSDSVAITPAREMPNDDIHIFAVHN